MEIIEIWYRGNLIKLTLNHFEESAQLDCINPAFDVDTMFAELNVLTKIIDPLDPLFN